MASYKKEAEKLRTENEFKRQANEFLEEQIKKMKAEKEKCEAEKKKRYDATVYCSNCKRVSNVCIPPGVQIIDGDCTHCRVRSNPVHPTLFQVVTYPGKI